MRVGQPISIGLALVGAVLALGFGAYLLLVGPETIFVMPDGPTATTRVPTLAGLIPVGIGLVALWGVASRRTIGYWVATVLAMAAAVLFLFSISGQLAVIAVVLLLAAVVRTVTTRDIQRR